MGYITTNVDLRDVEVDIDIDDLSVEVLAKKYTLEQLETLANK